MLRRRSLAAEVAAAVSADAPSPRRARRHRAFGERRWARALTVAMAALLVLSIAPVQARKEDKASNGRGPVVRAAVKQDSLASLKDAKVKDKKKAKLHEAQPLRKLPKAKGKGTYGPTTGAPTRGSSAPMDGTSGTSSATGGAAAVNAPVSPGMPSFSVNFEGVGNVDFVLPPDTEGDIGPDHYMQWVNLSFQVYDRSGNPLLPTPEEPAPQPGNSLFAGFGGICEETNWGDPIVQYDHLANRWMASQFALFGEDGNHHCHR